MNLCTDFNFLLEAPQSPDISGECPLETYLVSFFIHQTQTFPSHRSAGVDIRYKLTVNNLKTKKPVGAFNREKALVGAFSVIVKSSL